LFVDIW